MVGKRPGKRHYESPTRRARAAATRQQVVGAARALFLAQGYAATTIEAVAHDAGVAVQTIYATFGSKRAILLALLDALEAEADLGALTRELQIAADDERRQAAAIVAFEVRLFQRGAGVLAMVRGAGEADADLTALWRAGEARRRSGLAPVVRTWNRRGVLRAGVSERQALDIVWALTGADHYRLFVEECGWSARRYRAWLTTALVAALFGGADARASGG